MLEDVTRWVAGATDLVVDALYRLQDELAELRRNDRRDADAASNDEGDDARGFTRPDFDPSSRDFPR